jgi:hypothetical protein
MKKSKLINIALVLSITGLMPLVGSAAFASGSSGTAVVANGVLTGTINGVSFIDQDITVVPSQTSANSITPTVGPNGIDIAGTCYAGYSCMWVSADQVGGQGQFQGTNGWWGVCAQSQCTGSNAAPDASSTWNDCASSLENGQTISQTFFKNINYGGASLALAPDQYQEELTTTSGGNLNDAISSNQAS